ncbi:MAG: glycosyltransferase [Candidatus Jorgensenbacteria bacterium]|nr:glycosyltransferase [Candidatus Jorgensenbacteria bacterium]
MRVAILHDYLNQYGGAERVLEVLLEIFPSADIYTLLYDKARTFGKFENNIKKVSFLNIPFVRRKHRMFIPFMPLASRFLKSKEKYDLVISSTAGYGKGFRVESPYHVCYCLSPLRYAWEIDYLKDLPFSPWPLKEMVIRPIAKWLRAWDVKSSSRVNVFFADSSYIGEKVRAYYKRNAEVIYPPVDVKTFYPERNVINSEEYYMMAGRLLYYKRFDLGILACNKLRKKLKIIGMGPEFEKLKQIADPNYVSFIKHPEDEELRRLYSNAKAFIFPQIEDFGLVAAEAQACGVPVIAYNVGGGPEIVEMRRTGLLFDKQTTDAVIRAIHESDGIKWDRTYIAHHAQRFSKENFKKNFIKKLGKCGFCVDSEPTNIV